MATYSIGSPPTNAEKLADLQSVFNVLPDNTQKLISPLDVRSSVYTLWENIIFKPTNANGGTEYIGIDQDSFTEKIFFGKKKVGSQFLMNNNLLNTDVDVFFYNTKSTSNYDTKIAILAGTSSFVVSGQVSAPYLQSIDVTNPGYDRTINFEIINPSYYNDGVSNKGGDINIKSNNGVVSLNGLIFPTYADNTTGLGYDGYVLKYRWVGGLPYAVWEVGASFSADTLFSAGTVSITGNPVLLNGQNINFTSLVPVPNTLGGVISGMTFSNVPVTEMIRMLLYPYISPVLTLTSNYSIIEFGDSSVTSQINYSIIKNSTFSISSFAITSGSITTPPNLISAGSITNGTNNAYVLPNISAILNPSGTPAWTQSTWTFNITDGYPSSITASVNITTGIPWYYGSATYGYTTGTNINSILGTNSNGVTGKLTPFLSLPALTASSVYNKELRLVGNSVYVYFGYPVEYPDLYQIVDQNGFDVTSSFSKFTASSVDSPFSPQRWVNRTYKFYIYTGATATTPQLTTIGSFPNYSELYQFKFL